jgi:hypothetical protein
LGDFPNAEYVGVKGNHIRVHQDMGKKECDFVLNALEDFLTKVVVRKRRFKWTMPKN